MYICTYKDLTRYKTSFRTGRRGPYSLENIHIKISKLITRRLDSIMSQRGTYSVILSAQGQKFDFNEHRSNSTLFPFHKAKNTTSSDFLPSLINSPWAQNLQLRVCLRPRRGCVPLRSLGPVLVLTPSKVFDSLGEPGSSVCYQGVYSYYHGMYLIEESN